MFTNTNSSGSCGAPSQPAQFKVYKKMLVQHAYKISYNVKFKYKKQIRLINYKIRIGRNIPEDSDPIFKKQAAPSLMYAGSR
jgi:hypothetical protein